MPISGPAGAVPASALGAHAAGFTLSTPPVKPGCTLADAQIFSGFGCSGQNISPAPSWTGAPAGAKIFALAVGDTRPADRLRLVARGR